ncbi:hypothetical protein V8E54_003178 [Elaphomyces granulatus]
MVKLVSHLLPCSDCEAGADLIHISNGPAFGNSSNWSYWTGISLLFRYPQLHGVLFLLILTVIGMVVVGLIHVLASDVLFVLASFEISTSPPRQGRRKAGEHGYGHAGRKSP